MIDSEKTKAGISQTATREVWSNQVQVERSAVALVRGETVTFSNGAVGAVLARGDVSVTRGGGLSHRRR